MDLKIAIVEDETYIREELRKILLRWEQKEIRQYDIITRDFSTSEDFLKASEKFDLVFMDIELEKKDSGLKAAQKVKERKDSSEIVFLTSHKENVFVGYTVRALNFLVKPIKESEIEWCLRQVVSKISDECFIHNGRESFKIYYRDILYFKAKGHYMCIETVNGKYEIMKSLKQVLGELPGEFVQCHRTYIVNIHQIVSIRKNQIILVNKECVDLGEKYKNDVFQLYVKGVKARRI